MNVPSIPPLSAEERRERRRLACKLRLRGYTTRQIAKELGISRQRVSAILKRAGMPVGKRGATRFMGAHISRGVAAEASRMATEAGLSNSAMAALMIKIVVENPSQTKRLIERELSVARAAKSGEDA